jgi:hypothetical protein
VSCARKGAGFSGLVEDDDVFALGEIAHFLAAVGGRQNRRQMTAQS